MCGCEHHFDRNAPCTCRCALHIPVREEMAHMATLSTPDESLFIVCGCGHNAAWHSGGNCAHGYCKCVTGRVDVIRMGRVPTGGDDA